MSKLLDKICFLRDILVKQEWDKLRNRRVVIEQLREEIHRHIVKKENDYNHQLEFTAQDLRELAMDIRNTFKYWETVMSPEDIIKQMADACVNKQIDISILTNRAIPIMKVRVETSQQLIELLNIVEYYAVYLYYIELASNDQLAIQCTERLVTIK